MNAKDKKTFLKNLCNSVRDELIGKVNKMPEDWDGIELRQLLAEKFHRETHSRLLTGKRKRDYNNTIIVENL